MNYKLTIFPAFEAGDHKIEFLFESKKELLAASDTTSRLLIFMQDKAKCMDDYCNMFIEEEKIDGEWVDLSNV